MEKKEKTMDDVVKAYDRAIDVVEAIATMIVGLGMYKIIMGLVVMVLPGPKKLFTKIAVLAAVAFVSQYITNEVMRSAFEGMKLSDQLDAINAALAKASQHKETSSTIAVIETVE